MKRCWFWAVALLVPLSFFPAHADDAKIDLNEASREQFVALGLTESQATQIISHREKSGPLLQVDELLVVPQMRPDTVETIRERVTVDE